MIELKICGLHPGDDVSFTTSPVVTHIGVIFVSASKRYVSPAEAKPLLQRVDASCQPIAVTVDLSLQQALEVLSESGATGIQLHGQEPPEMCEQLRNRGYTVWKALQVKDGVQTAQAVVEHIHAYQDCVDAVLLDAAPPKSVHAQVTGGHGSAFDWTILGPLKELQPSLPPLWIAGGLTPENVPELLAHFRPDGVDVSSGVEENGRKATQRILAMIEAVSRFD